MKALSRKCTAFLLSLTLLLTLAPTALASEALGDDLDLRSTTLNRGAELGEGTFWSNTFSDPRQGVEVAVNALRLAERNVDVKPK